MADKMPDVLGVQTVNGTIDIVLVDAFRPVLEEGEVVACSTHHGNALYLGVNNLQKGGSRVLVFDLKNIEATRG